MPESFASAINLNALGVIGQSLIDNLFALRRGSISLISSFAVVLCMLIKMPRTTVRGWRRYVEQEMKQTT